MRKAKSGTAHCSLRLFAIRIPNCACALVSYFSARLTLTFYFSLFTFYFSLFTFYSPLAPVGQIGKGPWRAYR